MNFSASPSTSDGKIRGWVNQPNGRGTIDILWTCVFTCCLCCWTILCLNVPAQGDSRTVYFARKLKWALITILGPEILLIFAASQWATAGRFVRKFQFCGHQDWTMHHAFFAEMGGFLVEASDGAKFPVNNAQIYYLVTRGHMSFPVVEKNRITDRDKADGFARAITIWQVSWFSLQCLGRVVQGLSLTTIELSTLAFVFCSMPTFWCWSKKPLDVVTPIILVLDKPVEDIRKAENVQNHEHHIDQRTPFDFMDPLFWSVSSHGFSMLRWKIGPKKYPHERIANDRFAYVGHFKVICGQMFSMAYMAINFAAWNFSFPTTVERTIWRVCCVAMVVLMAVAGATMELMPGRFNKVSHWTTSRRSRTAPRNDSLPSEDHQLSKTCMDLVVHETDSEATTPPQYALPHFSVPLFCGIVVLFAAYSIVRLYFIVEVFVGLRDLPVTAYSSVQWINFLPHI